MPRRPAAAVIERVLGRGTVNAPYLNPGWALVAVAAFLLLVALFPDLN